MPSPLKSQTEILVEIGWLICLTNSSLPSLNLARAGSLAAQRCASRTAKMGNNLAQAVIPPIVVEVR